MPMLGIAGLGLVLLGALFSRVLCQGVLIFAPRIGLVDIPGGRKAHRAPTPLGGGLAIWLTVVIICGLGALLIGPGRAWLPEELAVHAPGLQARAGLLWILLGLSTLIMLLGLADDFRSLSWKPRLFAQLTLAALLVFAGARVTLFPPFSHPLVSGLITVFWIVGLTNAFNFLDNMDGLAGGVALISAFLLAAAGILAGGYFVPAVLLILVGALFGYLALNRYPAKIFMGDSGSNFLGFFLGGLSVIETYTRPSLLGDSPFGVLAPLMVMAVPLYDTFSVILIRLKEGRSPFLPDRRHFSHRLVDRGLTPPQAVNTIYLVTLTGGLGALLLHRLDALGACIALGQTVCLLGVVALLESSPGAGAGTPKS